MNIKFDTGNFTLNINGELSEESKAKMLENGLRYAVQRDVASKVYLGFSEEKTKTGKPKLPEGFERDSILFNEDNSAAMQLAAEAELAKIGTFSVTVSENRGGEGGGTPMVRATNLVETFLGTDMEASYRTILELPEGTKEELIEAANKMGLGISAPKGKKPSEPLPKA